MTTVRPLPCMALILMVASAFVVVSAMAETPWPPRPLNVPQATFQDYSQLFAWVAAERNLGAPSDESLVHQIQADSRIGRVHDRSAEPIAVVQVELRNPDGTSRARSVDGNFPFYVLRETPRGLVLMGRMFGRSYRSAIRGDHLEFSVELHPSPDKTVQMHFRVDDNVLVNLSAPHRQFSDVMARREN